jgi:hypothetical protein
MLKARRSQTTGRRYGAARPHRFAARLCRFAPGSCFRVCPTLDGRPGVSRTSPARPWRGPSPPVASPYADPATIPGALDGRDVSGGVDRLGQDPAFGVPLSVEGQAPRPRGLVLAPTASSRRRSARSCTARQAQGPWVEGVLRRRRFRRRSSVGLCRHRGGLPRPPTIQCSSCRSICAMSISSRIDEADRSLAMGSYRGRAAQRLRSRSPNAVVLGHARRRR